MAPTLPATQALALERARIIKDKALPAKLRKRGIWDDLGALKRWLIDDLRREQAVFAKEVMADVERR